MKNNISFSEGRGGVIFVTAETEADKIFLSQIIVAFLQIEAESVVSKSDSFFFEKGDHHCASLRWYDSQNGILDVDPLYKKDILVLLKQSVVQTPIESPY